LRTDDSNKDVRKQSQSQTGCKDRPDTFQEFTDRVVGVGLVRRAKPLIKRTGARVENNAALVHPGLLASGIAQAMHHLSDPRSAYLVGRA
jgi:hypothetical protein